MRERRQNMHRTAIASALLGFVSLCGCVAAAQDQQKTQPPPQSLSPLVPIGSPTATDPSKIAGSPQAPGTKLPGSAGVDDKTYIIGAEDVLAVHVYGQPISGEVTVRPDGFISILLAGEIKAAGLTPQQLEAAITERLKSSDLITDPRVTAEVRAVHSKKYYISGEVNKPGQYDLVVPTKISEALANAGGFKDFAKLKSIRIVRVKDGKADVHKFNYAQIKKGQHLEQNIYLEPGDQIYVD